MIKIIIILTFWFASILTQAWFMRCWHRFAMWWIITNIIALPVSLFVVGFITFAGLVVIFGIRLQTNDWPEYALPLGYLFALLIVWAILTTLQWFLLRQKVTSSQWWAAANNVVQLIVLFLLERSTINFSDAQTLSVKMLVVSGISGICVGGITGITIKRLHINL
ncbi:MAG: hypothetical protein WBA93_32430 [Microcoleaceae cyanobacterium]